MPNLKKVAWSQRQTGSLLTNHLTFKVLTINGYFELRAIFLRNSRILNNIWVAWSSGDLFRHTASFNLCLFKRQTSTCATLWVISNCRTPGKTSSKSKWILQCPKLTSCWLERGVLWSLWVVAKGIRCTAYLALSCFGLHPQFLAGVVGWPLMLLLLLLLVLLLLSHPHVHPLGWSHSTTSRVGWETRRWHVEVGWGKSWWRHHGWSLKQQNSR